MINLDKNSWKIVKKWQKLKKKTIVPSNSKILFQFTFSSQILLDKFINTIFTIKNID